MCHKASLALERPVAGGAVGGGPVVGKLFFQLRPEVHIGIVENHIAVFSKCGEAFPALKPLGFFRGRTRCCSPGRLFFDWWNHRFPESSLARPNFTTGPQIRVGLAKKKGMSWQVF